MFTLAFFVNVIFATTLLVFGAVAYATNKRSLTNQRFLWFVVCCTAWIVLNYISSIPTISHGALLWTNRFVLIIGGAAIIIFLDFLLCLVEARAARYSHLRWLVGVNMLAWLFCLTPFVINDVIIRDGQVFNQFSEGKYFYFTTLLLTAGYLIGSVVYYRTRLRGRRQQQLKTLSRAIALCLVIILIGNAILPLFGVYALAPYTPLTMSLLVISVAVSIVNHRLFDIKTVTIRTVGYALTIATLALIYLFATYIISRFLLHGGVTDKVSVSPLNAILSLVLAFIFQPIKRFFDHLTNRIFYRDEYDTNDFIERLGRILTSTTRLHEVLQKAGNEIETTLKANGCMFIVYRDHHPDAIVAHGMGATLTADNLTLLRDGILYHDSIVMDSDHIERIGTDASKRLYRLFHRKGIVLMLPLIGANQEVVGHLLLGEHRAQGYSKRDITVLEAIADELIIAIQNARSVQVVRDMNTHLEERVDSATKELQQSNKRLIELDATKDEFLSMASHQLRTPLTSVKGYISMVLEGDAGDITPAQRQLLEEAFASSERMVHLIGDFLNVSRLQTGKFVIERHEVDIAHVVAQEVEGMQQMATSHDIFLTLKKPAVTPVLYLDENKIRQVIMNFIDNAIYYSPERTPVRVTVSIEEGDVVIRVIDKGMGVPTDVQRKLFTKFFRAENARKQRPDGTGIGLYLAKRIIDGHHGKLVFESKAGKGSTFGFRLPIKRLSTPPQPDAE